MNQPPTNWMQRYPVDRYIVERHKKDSLSNRFRPLGPISTEVNSFVMMMMMIMIMMMMMMIIMMIMMMLLMMMMMMAIIMITILFQFIHHP